MYVRQEKTVPNLWRNERQWWEEGYAAGATAYATKLHQCDTTNKKLEEKNRGLEEKIKELERWKEEAKAILNPIWEYADTLKVPLGESKTEAVVKYGENSRKLLYEVFRKHESGLLPDRFIYEKIKTFLYGE